MYEVVTKVGNWLARNKKHVSALALALSVGIFSTFGSNAYAGGNDVKMLPETKAVATYSDYELIESADRALALPTEEVQTVDVEVVEMSELEEIAWDAIHAVEQFNSWLGGKCYAADGDPITLPSTGLDITGLAAAAFGVFGDVIETVFPYTLALAGVFLAMRFIKGLARGRD